MSRLSERVTTSLIGGCCGRLDQLLKLLAVHAAASEIVRVLPDHRTPMPSPMHIVVIP